MRLVPKTTASPKEAVLVRIKRHTREPGVIQCPRCGSRTSATLRNGSRVGESGRIIPGSLIAQHICADCYKNGIQQDMVPKLERIP
jgi:hypothetical protein